MSASTHNENVAQQEGEVEEQHSFTPNPDGGSATDILKSADIELHENKEIEPSSPEDSLGSGRNRVPNSSNEIIQDDRVIVKEKHSFTPNPDGGSTTDILKSADVDHESTQTISRKTLPVKAQNYLARTERNLLSNK